MEWLEEGRLGWKEESNREREKERAKGRVSLDSKRLTQLSYSDDSLHHQLSGIELWWVRNWTLTLRKDVWKCGLGEGWWWGRKGCCSGQSLPKGRVVRVARKGEVTCSLLFSFLELETNHLILAVQLVERHSEGRMQVSKGGGEEARRALGKKLRMDLLLACLLSGPEWKWRNVRALKLRGRQLKSHLTFKESRENRMWDVPRD